MKFDCGPTWQEKEAALQQWHRKFCLLPKRIGRVCHWLEYIERKATKHDRRKMPDGSVMMLPIYPLARFYFTWEYRAKP